ncbi:MAG: EAL domain-containing protein, partial [Lachnospiraceae bacterium]|nr:EAL domain-containing protein [Lachnospiraceae bacterium]
VSEAIKLAKNLNMHTVAEGVEEKSQVEFLAKQGCDMIQGYYYAHPMDKGDYEGCMRSGISERALKEVREAENAAKEAEAEGETNVETQPEAENESKTDAEEAMSAEAVQEAESAEAVQEAESAEAVQEAESAEEAIDELAEAPQNEAPQDEEPQDDGKEQA